MDRNMIKNARREITPYLEDLCRDLIRIPSQSGKEGNLADLVKKKMIEFGYDKVSVDNLGNVIGIKNGLKNRPLLLFDGHMDTVPPGNRRLWRDDAFSGKISKGSIFGRGAIDMKSALAAMILIPYTLKVLGSKLKAKLATALVVLEEPCEGLGVRNIIEKKGLIPDAVVLGEPSNLALAIGHRGRFEVKVNTYGKSCHSSMPERGINAINKMFPMLRRVEVLNRRLPTHPTLGRATIAVFKITSTPTIGNLIPDVCEVLLDRRTLPGENKSQILRECRESILSEANRSKASIYKMELETYTGKKLKVEQKFPYWILPKSHWLTRLVKESAISVGLKPAIRTWRFGTDGSYTAGVKRIPTIGFGPGEPERAHTPNESVPIHDVVTSALVYAHIAQNWDKGNLS